MTYPIVLCRWADAHMSDPGWLDLDNLADMGEAIVETVGFMIPEGDPGHKPGHVSLWQTFGEGQAIHGMWIPVDMVRDIILLNGSPIG